MNQRREIIKALQTHKHVGIKKLACMLGLPLHETKRYILRLEIDGVVKTDNRGVSLTENVFVVGGKTYAIADRGYVAIEKYNELHKRPQG